METKNSLQDNALSDMEKKKLKSDVASISTTSTALDELPPAYDEFASGKSFFIDARGIGLIRLPLPSSQLEIPIHNSDGSLAYLSTRDKKCSGDSVLSSPKGGDLVDTSYFFGPSRDPIIRLRHSGNEEPQEIKVTGKWTSRGQRFVAPNGSEFQWRYVRPQSTTGCSGSGNLLVLEQMDGKSSAPGRRLAQLVRNDQTRPEGTRKSTAGNGGQLLIAPGADMELDEALIVATCLLMLKKEIDRRRLIQIMVLAGAGSGGG